MKHVKGLDTLRAFAVFLVIIEHFGVWFDDSSPSGRFVRQILIPDGGFGVDLFFVLSGFLITGILLRSKNAPVVERTDAIKTFFIRRALRIFPVYYLLLLLLFGIRFPDIRQFIGYFGTYTTNFLLWRTNTWNNFSHAWTLAVEEQFYLIWPWAVIFVNKKHLSYLFYVAILCGILTTYLAIAVQHHIGPFMVCNCLDAFGIGALYAWANQDTSLKGKFESYTKMLIIPTFVFYFYLRFNIAYIGHVDGLFLYKTSNCLISIWLIILVMNARSGWVKRRLLENGVLTNIGRISYGIYLYHYVYINFFCGRVNKFLYDITARWPTAQKIIHDHHTDYWIQVSIIVLISAVSYQFIELPFLRLKDRFAYVKATTSGDESERTQ